MALVVISEVMADGHTTVFSFFFSFLFFFFFSFVFDILAVWLGCMAWLYGLAVWLFIRVDIGVHWFTRVGRTKGMFL